MSIQRIIGLVLLAVGVALLFFGYNASQSVGERVVEGVTGHFDRSDDVVSDRRHRHHCGRGCSDFLGRLRRYGVTLIATPDGGGRLDIESTGNKTRAVVNFRPKLGREFLVNG